jgi:hypothetical protein
MSSMPQVGPATIRVAGLVLALVASVVVAPVSAQISFYPPVVHVPAGGASGWLQLVSASSEPVDVRLTLHFAYPESDNTGRVRVPAAGERPADDPRSAVPHVRFGPERLRLLPGRAQRVRFVAPDPQLPAGEYWARLTIEPERGPRALDTPLDVGASRAMMDSRVRIVLPVFVRSGPVAPEIALDSVVAWTEGERVHVRPWLRNTGSAAGLGRARVELLDGRDRVIDEQERHVAVYTEQSPRFSFDVSGLEARPRTVRFSFTDDRDDLPQELRPRFASLEVRASIREPAGGDYYYALERRGREVGVLRGRVDWEVDGRPVHAWFPLRDVAAPLGVQVLTRPGESTVYGHLPLEQPVSFRLDPATGRASRDGLEVALDPGQWRWADSTLYVDARALQTLTGIQLEERAHTLTLHVRGSDRSVPRFAGHVGRRAGQLARQQTAATPVLPSEVDRYAPMLPSALHLQHATWLGAADDLRGVVRIGASLAGGGFDLTAPWRRRPTTPAPASGLRWRWVSGLRSGSARGQLRIGWGLPAGLGSAEPGVGVWLTNAPFRRPSEVGARVHEGVTEPGAEVQLWVGGRLLDAVVADATGAWRLDMPLIGGENRAELRFLRSDGVFRQSVFVVADPELLPVGRVEYALSIDRPVDAERCRTGFEVGCNLRSAADLRWAPIPRLTLLGSARIGSPQGQPPGASASSLPRSRTRVDARAVWAPFDRVLSVAQVGSQGWRSEWSYRSPGYLEVRGFVENEGPAARAFGARRWGVALQQRSTGLFGAALHLERREAGRRLDLVGARIDLRQGPFLTRLGADLRRARSLRPRAAAGARAGSASVALPGSSWASTERLQFLAARLPQWTGILKRTRWGLDLRTRRGFRSVQAVALNASRRLGAAGTLDAVADWSPGRPVRLTLRLRRAWAGLQLGHTLASSGTEDSGWQSSLAVSGTATITGDGWVIGERSHERPGSVRVFAYLDANLDGRRGRDEPVLADVAVHVAGHEVVTTLDGVQVGGLPTQTPLPLRVDPQVPNWDAEGRTLAARSPETWFQLAPYAHERIEVAFAPAHRVEGRVLERASRTALAGAVVELVRDEGGEARSAVADASGTFVFPLLPAGRYHVAVAESTLGVLGVVSAPVEVVLDDQSSLAGSASGSAALSTMLEVWAPAAEAAESSVPEVESGPATGSGAGAPS